MSLLSTSAEYAKIAWSYTSRVIAPFFFGVAINWVFAFVYFVGALQATSSLENGVFRFLMTATFLIGFPFLYFWLARSYAVKKGLELLYKGNAAIVSKTVDLVVSASVAEDGEVENSGLFKSKTKAVKGAANFIKQLSEKLPRPIQRILTFLLEQMPLQAMILEVGKSVTLKSENIETIKPLVQEKVDDYVVNELIGADLSWFWILVVLNGAAMYLSWMYL